MLVDGYSSYLIADKYDLGVVPVYFVDWEYIWKEYHE